MRYLIREIPGLRPSYTVYDRDGGVWYKGRWWGKQMWVMAQDNALKMTNREEAHKAVEELEAALERAIAGTARVMNPIVREMIVAAGLIVALCAVTEIVYQIIQAVWGL